MPWRLIGFIVIFAIFLVFIILNMGNKCDISFGFTKMSDVPVFLTAFSSFIIGMVCAFPFFFFIGRRKKEKSGQKDRKPKKSGGKDASAKSNGGASDKLSDGGNYGID